MVVLAAAICSRSGAISVSRQYVSIGKSRVESLLSQFPRLRSSAQEHTFVEGDHVRYLWKPLEDHHYLVVLTNLGSNILNDMEILSMLGRIVDDCVSRHGADENHDWLHYREEKSFVEQVNEQAMEIILGFDEIVQFGYGDPMNWPEFQTILAMESQEEIIQEIIAKNKMQEAKEAAKRKIKQIEMEKREQSRRGSRSFGSSGSFSPLSDPLQGSNMIPAMAPSPQFHQSPQQNGEGNSSNPGYPQTTVRAGKGMKLGKTRK